MITPEMREAIRAIQKPVPMTVDIAAGENGFRVVVYEQEVMAYPELDRYVIMEYLETVRETLEQFGVEVELEGRAGLPRRR